MPDDKVEAPSNNKRTLKLSRLRRARERSYQVLTAYRDEAYDAIQQYVGSHYGNNQAIHEVPINLIELAVNIYGRQLSARNPRVLVTTKMPGLGPTADSLGVSVNKLIEEINLRKTIRRWVRNAFFGLAIVKVGITGHESYQGAYHDTGQPYADVVDIDDWCHDMTVRRWEQTAFRCNHYTMPLEVARNSPHFIKKYREQLTADEHYPYTELGDNRLDNISRGITTDPDAYYDIVHLWDYYLPHEKLVFTLPDGENEELVLRIQEWEGPEEGMYRRLDFTEVPGQAMPLPPAALWVDMHELANKLFRKLSQEATDAKTIIAARLAALEDAQRVIEASDCEVVPMDDPAGLKALTFNGVNQSTLAFTILVRDLFSYFGGNLDALGGLSPQSETLGQDQILAMNASRRLSDMQDNVTSAVKEVCKDLAWYRWHDPIHTEMLEKQITPGGISVKQRWGPEERIGRWHDFAFDVNPYSMADQTPATRLRTLMTVLGQVILPLGEELMRQGRSINMDELIDIFANYADLPELKQVIGYSALPGQEQQEGGQQEGGRRPASTTRRYERVNRPGRTRQGADLTLMQSLLGKGVQGAEAEAAVRMTG